MAFSTVSLAYKPLRIGFLVRDGSVDDLVTAAGINTLLWGGIYNPIIPINETNNDFADQLIQLFAIDILYAVAGTNEILDFKKRYPFLRDRYTDDIFYQSMRSNGTVLRFLDSKNVIDYLWENDFKQWKEEDKSYFTLPEWESNDELASLFSLEYGHFPKLSNIELQWDYKKLFLEGLHAKQANISLDRSTPLNAKEEFSPIQLTKVELNYAEVGRIFHRGVYIGLKDNFADLFSFWNLRAAGEHIVFLAKDAWERTFPYVKTFIDFIDGLPNRSSILRDPVTVYYSQIDEQEYADIAQKISSKKGLSRSENSEHLWNGLNLKPVEPFFKKWQQVNSFVEQSHSGFLVTLDLPEKRFLVNDDEVIFDTQQLGVIIDASGDHYYPGFTLDVPCIAELNEFYSRSIKFDPWELRGSKNGLTSIISTTDNTIRLLPINKVSLIKRFFALVEIDAIISQPGLIANKIIEKIGGIESSRVLKIKGVRSLFEELSRADFVTRSKAEQTIFENDFEKHKDLYIEGRTAKKLTAPQVFNFLLKKDFFRAGLVLECSQCKLSNWLSLKNIDDTWDCEYCGANDIISIHLRHRGDWQFRKSGLFAKDNHQEGAIPVLLTLLTLKRVLDGGNFGYTTAMKLNGRHVNCETDFCVYQSTYNDGLEIAIGESKSEGGTITKQDCDNLKSVAVELSKIGTNTNAYIIFSKTADSFRAEEISLFNELKEEFNIILFTNQELELYYPYSRRDGEINDLPQKYPNSMKHLSQNSIFRYLQ